MKIKRQSLISLLGLGLFLSGCVAKMNSNKTDELAGSVSSRAVYGAGYGYKDFSVTDLGVFYIRSSNDNLLYYDFAADKNYYLCTKANCFHNSESCLSYVGNAKSVGGYGFYDGNAYVLLQSEEDWRVSLIKIDIENQTKQVIAQFGDELTMEGGWVVSSIGNVYYHKGYAWIDLSFTWYGEDVGHNGSYGKQLFAVDLSDGDIIEITSLLRNKLDYSYINFETFTDHYVVIEILAYAEPSISEEEYLAEGHTEEEYRDYWLNNSDLDSRYQTFLAYDLSEFGKDSVEPITLMADIPYKDPFIFSFYGEYSGQLIGDRYEEIDGIDYEYCFRMDVQTGDITYFHAIENGGALAQFSGDAYFGLYDGEKIYYLLYTDEGADVYLYSLKDEEDIYLFSDITEISFRIYGEAESYLVGKINKMSDWALISKEDYESGNMDAIYEFLHY